MICTLMHKRLAVAGLEIDNATGLIQKIYAIYVPEHLPVGTLPSNGIMNRAALNDWWGDRSIPTSRFGVRQVLEALEISNPKQLLVQCYGLSLFDQYWICPQGASLTWDVVNFFDNPFSDDIGDVLFGVPPKGDEFDFSSPDSTTDGNLKKRWKIINGKRCLIKGGSNPFQQQPFNEVIATKVMERLGIPHIPYTLLWSDGLPYSVCEVFVTSDTELVSAWRVMLTQKKDNNTSVYQHFVNCCQVLGVSNVIPALDQMIVLDYLIANEDRHLNNFGLLRNPETLEWIGMAPIFDSGSSLGYDKTGSRLATGTDVVCKPFKRHHQDQLKLVSSLDWVDFDALKDVGDMIHSVLSEPRAINFVGFDRMLTIEKTTQERVRHLQEMAMTHCHNEASTSTKDDVKENIAEDYTPKMTL